MNLPYNIYEPSEKQQFDTICREWIDLARAEHMQYVPEWNDVDRRMTGDYTPVGFTDNYVGDLVKQSDPTLSPEEKDASRTYVTVNRTRPNHEAVLGDFVFQRRRLQISGRTPSDRNRARVIKSRVEYIEDVEQIPERVYFPTFDNGFARGLHWIKIRARPHAPDMRTRLEVNQVTCRDVMVDPGSRSPFYEDTEYRIQRKRFLVKDAKKMFKKYPLFNPDALYADNEYEDGYGARSTDVNDRYCTFYEIHFREYITPYYELQGDNKVKQIDEDRYRQLNDVPEVADTVYEGKGDYAYYVAVFHTTQGVISLGHNPVNEFTLLPFVNTHTDARLYPLGDQKMYKNLADLLDVLVTVFLDHGKRLNAPIAEFDDEHYSTHKAAMDRALRRGGGAVGIKQIWYPQQLNQALTGLIPWVLDWIQDTASKHKASMGELPTRQIAHDTVQTLISKDRQAQGRKDVMIRYTLTQLAMLLVKFIKLYDTEPDFTRLRDEQPGKPDYIPVNQQWSESEYIANLAEMNNMMLPQTGADEEAFWTQMAEIRRTFEADNDVKIEKRIMFTIDDHLLSPEELEEMIETSEYSELEFFSLYTPEETEVDIYHVNSLGHDVNLNILYDIDDDYKNDPEFKSNRALLLNSRGAMSRLDMLKEMDVANAEELIKNVDSENQALALAKEIASDPELMEAVQELMRRVQEPQSAE